MIITLTLVACILHQCASAYEIFKNIGMEDPDIEGTYGHPWGYVVTRLNDSHSGLYAVKISGRTASWQGIGQDVYLQQNKRYSIHAYIKQLTNGTKLWQGYSFTAVYQWSTNASDKQYVEYARHSFGSMAEGWFKLGGDFTTPSKTWQSLRLFIQGPDPGIEFLVDDLSLQEIPVNVNWKTEAQQRIEQLRKSNFSISINISDHFDPHHVEIEINLRKHGFAFGSVISDEQILSPNYKIYQNLFYEFFNWATVGSFKWDYNRGNATHPNYDRSVQATEELRRQGLLVRGHNMFWGVSMYTPEWVHHLSADQLRKTIEERVNFMTNITKNKLEHWDVNNELLHGHLYEEMTRDPNYSQEIYRMVHAHDPRAKLFLNEYNVVAVGASTDDYVNQGKAFKAANCGLYGLGVQSHFQDYVAPDPTLMKYRLDKLATTGLPLWVTELTLAHANENIRADWFEDALTLYFSHPSIEGIVLWGFWDHDGASADGALVNGNNYYINAAGKRYLELTKNTWSTNLKLGLSTKNSHYTIRGFHGDYDVIVRYMGKPIQILHFTLHKNEQGKMVKIDVNGNGDEIVLPTLRPTFTPVHHVHHATHDHTRTLGQASVHSGSSKMICTTRYSGLSAVGDDKTTDVGCHSDEILVGCSSLTKDSLSFRDGEYVVIKNGQPECRAVNAWRSAAPVQAVARCCSKAGLQCTYMTAGPSANEMEDQIQVICPPNTIAMGCTSYTYFGTMDGAFSNGSVCTAQNDGTNAVFTYASCCHAPSTQCYVRKSVNAGIRQGEIASAVCLKGETLASCSVYTEDGKTAGAIPHDNGTCIAVNGFDRFPGEDSVTAVAVCCT